MSGFKFDVNTLGKGLAAMESKVDVAMMLFAETAASKLEESAKENRTWTDRTSSARLRMKGRSFRVSNGYRLELAHGVNYGVWLELANEKKYAIIDKTIRYVGTFEIMPAFTNFMNKLK